MMNYLQRVVAITVSEALIMIAVVSIGRSSTALVSVWISIVVFRVVKLLVHINEPFLRVIVRLGVVIFRLKSIVSKPRERHALLGVCNFPCAVAPAYLGHVLVVVDHRSCFGLPDVWTEFVVVDIISAIIIDRCGSILVVVGRVFESADHGRGGRELVLLSHWRRFDLIMIHLIFLSHKW